MEDDDDFANLQYERLDVGSYVVVGEIRVNGKMQTRRIPCNNPAGREEACARQDTERQRWLSEPKADLRRWPEPKVLPQSRYSIVFGLGPP